MVIRQLFNYCLNKVNELYFINWKHLLFNYYLNSNQITSLLNMEHY